MIKLLNVKADQIPDDEYSLEYRLGNRWTAIAWRLNLLVKRIAGVPDVQDVGGERASELIHEIGWRVENLINMVRDREKELQRQ